MAAVPLSPSLVAVIVTAPAAAPVTRPLLLTVAQAVLELVHVTVRPVRVLPLASFSVAVSCSVCPTSTLPDAGLTVTEATGTFVTVMAAVPLCPSLVAVTVAEPAATPVTTPLLLTVAEAVLELVHVTVRPLSVLPLASFRIAVNCSVCAIGTLANAGLTVTDATGTFVTAMAAVPLCPSLVAVIIAVPAAMAVARPADVTVAISELELDQVMARPAKIFPLLSLATAASWIVPPTCTLADVGLRVTDATGTGVTVTTAVSEVPPGFPVATTLTFPEPEPAL